MIRTWLAAQGSLMLLWIRIAKLFVIDVLGHPNQADRLRIDWDGRKVWLEDPERFERRIVTRGRIEVTPTCMHEIVILECGHAVQLNISQIQRVHCSDCKDEASETANEHRSAGFEPRR